MFLLSKGGYIAIAIGIILVLLITFVVTFVLYKKTPVPKGCEDLSIDKTKCSSCSNSSCPYAADINKKEEK